MAPVLSGGATVSWFSPGPFVLLKIPASGVWGATSGPRSPRDATAAAWSFAARRAPSSSVRNGWAKTGWLSEVADPWARTIGVISPTADRIAPAVVGLAPTAGAAIQELPARRVTTETRLRPTRVRRDAVHADIETPFTFDWTAILRRTGRPVETVLCRRSSWARMGPRGSRMMGGCRTNHPGRAGSNHPLRGARCASTAWRPVPPVSGSPGPRSATLACSGLACGSDGRPLVRELRPPVARMGGRLPTVQERPSGPVRLPGPVRQIGTPAAIHSQVHRRDRGLHRRGHQLITR